MKAVKLRFLTEELGFESDHDCAEFLLQYISPDLLSVKDDGSAWLTTGSQTFKAFDDARKQAFSKVDIRGQI